MADRQLGLDVRPYLPHAAAATLGVVALPAALIFAMLFLVDPDPNFLITSAFSIGLTAAATTLGAALWMRQERSSELSFGDLMLWAWYRRKRAEERLQKSVGLLGLDRSGIPLDLPHVSRARQLRILHDLNEALEAKDPYTRGHADRVERHVFRTGAAMGLSVQELDDLRLAAALHDVGKIRVPDSILRKEGSLTDDEREIMNEHAPIGAMMVSHVGSKDVIEAVRHHHEHWNGRGYPDGLEGAEIPLFARIISVADTYDAITSTRSYRVKSEKNKALSILKAEAGRQFDPMTVEAFCEALPHRVPVVAIFMLVPSVLREAAKHVALLFTRQGVASITAGAAAAGAAVGISATAVRPIATLRPEAKPLVVQEQVAPSESAADVNVAVHRRGDDLAVRTRGRSARNDARSDGFRAQVHGGGDRIPEELPVLPSPSPERLATTPVADDDDAGTAETPLVPDEPRDDASGSNGGNDSDGNGSDDDRGRGNSNSNSGDGKGNSDDGKGNSNSGDGKGNSNEGKGNGKVVETPNPDPTDSDDTTGADDSTDKGNGSENSNAGGNENSNVGGNGNGGGSENSKGGGSENSNAGGNGDSGGSSGSTPGNSGGRGGGSENSNAGGNGNGKGGGDK